MDLSAISQIKNKRGLWVDILFYFVMSLLIATVFCYLIFLVKNGMIRKQIAQEISTLKTVGTQAQKDQETEVKKYQKKINDFSALLKNHGFASNVFAFIQSQTLPNVWFKQFNLDAKGSSLQLSGQSDTMDVFSRQIAVLEKNKYVKNLGSLSSSLGESAKIQFNLNILLNQDIFTYIADNNPNAGQNKVQPVLTGASLSQSSSNLKKDKAIISFYVLLNPQVIGKIDEKKHSVTLTLPADADLTNLPLSINVSPGAIISPSVDEMQDFSTPVDYTVTAEDGSTQIYTVTALYKDNNP